MFDTFTNIKLETPDPLTAVFLLVEKKINFYTPEKGA
jgi:hypothetical protein